MSKKLVIKKKPDLISTTPTANSYVGLSQMQLLEKVSLLHNQLLKINNYLAQLHRLAVYDYNYDDTDSVEISLPETNKGFLLDSAIHFRGEWNPQTNTPTLEKTDSSKVGWSYIANASGGSAETITNVLKGDFIVYDAEGNLFNLTAWINARLSLDLENKSQSDRAYADSIVNALNDIKVNKSLTILGIDLKDNILIGEFRTALGNATQSVAGLLSAEDKTHLDGLVALLETSDGNNVVDTIGEILQIFQNYPEGADLLTVLQGKADKTDVYTKPETYTQQEINALFDNLSAVKGLKSTLLTPTELSNGDTISTNLLTNNGAYIVFTATDTSTEEIDSDTVPVSTIKTGKKFVFFDNQEIVFTIGETNSTFETSEDITLKINLLYLDSENVQAVGVDFDGSLTNYLLSQTNVQEAIKKLDSELKTTNDNKVDKITGKGLSTEDYTTTEKNKLSGIEAGAEVNVQSDWTQEVNTADDYIKNKPTIPTKISDLTNDSGFITTETDPIFTAWNKSTGISITKSQVSDLIEATQSLSGLMSATDKQRLDALHSLLEEDTENSVVDSINEILAIFNNYPEGADLVTALAGKVDKTSIIDNLTTYDATKVLSAKQGKVLKDLIDTTVGNIDAILNSILGV